MIRRLGLVQLVLLLAMPFVAVEACGPDFFPDVFLHRLGPDRPQEFAAGKLGILLATYPRQDLVVAFRYLNGGVLTPDEQQGYSPMEPVLSEVSDEYLESEYERQDAAQKKTITPAMEWEQARMRYGATPNPVDQSRCADPMGRYSGTQVYMNQFENCGDDALRHATGVLAARAKVWGVKSRELEEWLRGQDAVFTNCSGKDSRMPSDVAETWPELLRQDRAYQTAAAQFYRGEYDDAISGFERIGSDATSPWRGLAKYLTTRAMIRKAFFAVKPDDAEELATFDMQEMKRAQGEIERLLQEQGSDLPRRALRRELDLVRLRTEPMAQVRRLGQALGGPGDDAEYRRHLADLTWLLDKKLDNQAVRVDADPEVFTRDQKEPWNWQATEGQKRDAYEETYQKLGELRKASPLVDWLITFQSPAEAARKHALGMWKETGKLPWLVAAIGKARGDDPDTPALVDAAATVREDSPAWEMMTYHRARLLIGMGRAAEAGKLLAETAGRVSEGKRDSSMNLYQGLRMRAASTLDEALEFAPRKILVRVSEEQSSLAECQEVMKNPKRKYDCKQPAGDAEFDRDAATLFNEEMPLNRLADVALKKGLPENMEQALAEMVWVRSVLMGDDASAAKVLPLLPEKIRAEAGAGTDFRPTVTLVRNPGLRPYLDAGVQRSYSYDFVESYRDNWWCRKWDLNESDSYWQQRVMARFPMTEMEPAPAFLSAEERSLAKQESAKLRGMDSADVVLGQRILTYAKAHPEDPDVPEALFLVLRMVRYSCGTLGGPTDEASRNEQHLENEVREGAARILRQRYAASPWTKKAAPFVR